MEIGKQIRLKTYDNCWIRGILTSDMASYLRVATDKGVELYIHKSNIMEISDSITLPRGMQWLTNNQ